MKSYTSLEQSKKLAKILPPESADMYYTETSRNNFTIGVLQRMERDMLFKQAEYYKMFPCWSLAALFNILPNASILLKGFDKIYDLTNSSGEIARADNPIDACYEMILKLNELKML